MAGSMVIKLACLVLVCMVVSAPMAKADLSCGQVVSYLMPCANYVISGGAVSANCCNGIKTVFQSAQTPTARQNVCKCLKSAINGVPTTGSNVGLAASLPGKCGLNIPYKIDPNTDCNSLN